MVKLNFAILAPMYFEEDYDELCKRADSLGTESLTEDQQYFTNTYHRLDNFISQLPPADIKELENAADNNEIYNKYSNAEMKFYIDTHKVSNKSSEKTDYVDKCLKQVNKIDNQENNTSQNFEQNK